MPVGFYLFRQQNVDGSYNWNRVHRTNVIIEAASSVEANRKALSLGIYFNGVLEGKDCKTCGDRWEPIDLDNNCDESPKVFGIPIIVVPTVMSEWADTVIVYFGNSISYGFSSDIFSNGIPVPPQVAEWVGKGDTGLKTICPVYGGGWKVGYKGELWSLVQTPRTTISGYMFSDMYTVYREEDTLALVGV